MKYTLEGFSQETALNLTKKIKKNDETKTIRLDIIDLVLLRWFVDFFPNMKKMTVNNSIYGWVNYSSVVEELPILSIQKKSVYERFKKMCDLGILIHHFDKSGGCYSYYGFGEKYNSMISSSRGNRQDSEGVTVRIPKGNRQDSEGVTGEIPKGNRQDSEGVTGEIPNKDPSTINPSTINPSTINPTPLGGKEGKQTKKEKKNKIKACLDESSLIDEYITELPETEDVKEKLLGIIQNRVLKNKPTTIQFIKYLLALLEKYSSGDYETKIDILNKSIEYGYCTVYPLRHNSNIFSNSYSNPEYHAPSYELSEYENSYNIFDEIDSVFDE